MPAAAWVTLVIATLIIAAAALGLIRVIVHLMAVRKTLGTSPGASRSSPQQDQHRARGAAVGQRQPQARPRLLRIDLREAIDHATHCGSR